MKHITAYKEVLVKKLSEYHFTCDTCGHVFAKGERKVTYHQQGKSELHGCIDKPCTPFSNPKDYETEWNIEKQSYEWVKKGEPTHE